MNINRQNYNIYKLAQKIAKEKNISIQKAYKQAFKFNKLKERRQ